jgi:hypothetical protein
MRRTTVAGAVAAGLGLVAAACVAACAVTPTQRREETLVREARGFNDDLRWARYEQLHLSLPPGEAQLIASRAAALGDDLMIGDYEVTSITFAPGSEAATVMVKFDWYSKRVGIVHSSTLEQRWELQGGRWLVTKQRRVRGERFPLVTEPAPPPPAAP